MPVLGVLSAAALFAWAAGRYPGGYDWWEQSISSLFQPLAASGDENAGRIPAAVAVVLFCSSIAFVFYDVAKRGRSRLQRKTIQIAGIGSMVYAGLMITPMHDTLVGVALVFFVTAMLAVFRWLQVERRWAMLSTGLLCLAGTLANATLYYGDVLFGFLPPVQKLSLLLWVGWLFALYYRGDERVEMPQP